MLTEPVLREVALVRAWLPWLPMPGIGPSGNGNFYHAYDVASRSHRLAIPTTAYPTPTLRQVIRHEMGHLWTHLLGLRVPGFDVVKALQVDPAAPTPSEVTADIFARAMGEQPTYLNLETYSRPTAERVAFIEASGRLPDRQQEAMDLQQRINAFWARTDIDPYFRDWAANYQTWLDLNVLRYMGLID